MSSITNFLRRFAPLAALFFAMQIITRTALLLRERASLDSLGNVLSAYGFGVVYDVSVLAYALAVFAFFFLCIPKRAQNGKPVKFFFFLAAYIFVFTAFAEWIFWDEFGTRFNFIAVDYLVYTQEVIGNIQESYPMPLLLSAIALLAAIITWCARRKIIPANLPSVTIGSRAFILLVSIALAAISWAIAPSATRENSSNTYADEAGKNGMYTLFSAFWHNEIEYAAFYPTLPEKTVEKRLPELLAQKKNTAAAKRMNVIMVVMESMSGDYMGVFGNTQKVTPNLDRLADESLFFTNLYATGTRTVRGLEAVTVSRPPLPGNSLVREVNNENLAASGFIFKDHGYSTKFIYGGYGYFDNMNYFFANNGFSVVDRTDMPKDQVEFGNVWGVSDEDLFRTVLKEADKDYAAKKPFMQVVMTTSNHRPYTYPEGRIDLPPKSGRMGGVKYADYAVGQLVKQAKTKPWFDNTLFIFVADHTAGSSGKVAVDPAKYHIPAMIYSPANIKPQKVDMLVSQIDVMPTVLGLLGFDNGSKFYGKDILHNEINRAFISTYQYMGYMTPRGLTILKPSKKRSHEDNNPDWQDAVVYYQAASEWRKNLKRD